MVSENEGKNLKQIESDVEHLDKFLIYICTNVEGETSNVKKIENILKSYLPQD